MAKKILAVDDDPIMLQIVADAIEIRGYELFKAMNGKEALRLARAHKPDVMLLDLMMPEMHGFEVCRLIREDTELCKMRIIVLTAKNYEVDRKTAVAAGADHYVVKPFKLPELMALIEQ